jgi:N-formylglutamate amidohydrolase
VPQAISSTRLRRTAPAGPRAAGEVGWRSGCGKSSRIRRRAWRSRVSIEVSYRDESGSAAGPRFPPFGPRVPADFDAIVGEAELRESRTCYVDELYAAAHELGAPLLAASSRVPTWIQPPRRRLDLELIDGRGRGIRPSGKARIGKALVWRTLEDGRPIYAHKLAPEVVRGRIQRFHAPYHQSLKDLLDKTHRKFGRVYHINCHSMRAVAGKQSDDGQGAVRADFVLGDRDGTTCEARFTEFVRQARTGMGYSVKVNDPTRASSWCARFRPEARPPQPADRDQQAPVHGRGSLRKGVGFARLQKNLGEL